MLTSRATSRAALLYNGLVAGRGAGVARTFGVGEAGGSNPLVPTSFHYSLGYRLGFRAMTPQAMAQQ